MFSGLAVMIILIPVNGFIANKIKTLQIRQMKNKDERVKLMNEILSGIKVCVDVDCETNSYGAHEYFYSSYVISSIRF